MIGHQNIRVNLTMCSGSVLTKPAQVRAVVLIREKARLAVVAALDDVGGDVSE